MLVWSTRPNAIANSTNARISASVGEITFAEPITGTGDYVLQLAQIDGTRGKVIDFVLAQLSEVDDWAKGDIHAVAEQLAPAIGLPVPVVEVALKRQAYGIKPVTENVIADQQRVADSFFALGLLPKKINISDAARRSGT